ncbi:MAG: GTPase [Schumannella sp.]
MNLPDPRLETLAGVFGSERIVPATVSFVDIAGIVKGASEGEGLGNQFLANIREADAIAQVVRGFDDGDVVHVAGAVDPASDLAVITTEARARRPADPRQGDRAVQRRRRRSRARMRPLPCWGPRSPRRPGSTPGSRCPHPPWISLRSANWDCSPRSPSSTSSTWMRRCCPRRSVAPISPRSSPRRRRCSWTRRSSPS